MAQTTEVRYFVLPDTTNPYLLARVRWPDVSQAISKARPEWQDDPGLFDLPYSPSSTQVTLERATALAANWGADLPDDETPHPSGPILIRRMPADWSNLSPAEKRAWALEFLPAGGHDGAGQGSRVDRWRVGAVTSWFGKWQRRRPAVTRPPEPAEVGPGLLPLDPAGALPFDHSVDLVVEPIPELSNLSADGTGLLDVPSNGVHVPETNHDGAVRR